MVRSGQSKPKLLQSYGILVGDLLGMFIVHLLKKKIPERKGGSITPLRIMTRFDGHCSLRDESNISKKKYLGVKVGRSGTWTNLQHWIPVLMGLHLGHVKKCLQSHRDLSASPSWAI